MRKAGIQKALIREAHIQSVWDSLICRCLRPYPSKDIYKLENSILVSDGSFNVPLLTHDGIPIVYV